jgi:glycosyltransferase involved in cell wall biosynthesis
LSVVVPTRDRPLMLDRALASLRESLDDADELVVVDSASAEPGATEDVAAGHGARVVRCARPGGSVARNAGWRSATHALVAFCDDDIWVAEEWADALVAAFDATAGVGFVTGRIDIPPGQQVRGVAISIIDRLESSEYDARSRGLLGHGANMAARRTALEQVGGFDELLGAGARFPGSEEGDLFDRLFAAGWRGRYEPGAHRWHDQWRDRQRVIVRLDYGYGRGRGARLSKLVRTDRSRARVMAREYLWEWGLLEVVKHVRARDRFLSAVALARLAGLVVGFVAGLQVSVRDGHFRSRRAISSS